MHTLDQYFAQPGAKSPAQIAAEAGISESTLSRIRSGKQNTTRDVMRAIIAATDNRVSASSLLGLHITHDSTGMGLTEICQDGGGGEGDGDPFVPAPVNPTGASSPTSSPTAGHRQPPPAKATNRCSTGCAELN